MSNFQKILAAALLALAGAASAEVRLVPQVSGVGVRLRGISAVDAQVAWASGREGTVLRTVDGGKSWQVIRVPESAALDFRDIEGFDANTAVVLSIGPGEASRIYRTADGGKHWQRVLQNRDPRGFFDCMAFDGELGWMLGDPVDGRFQVFATGNGGRDWRLLPDGPSAAEGEAAFAASGTCVARVGNALVVGTGGSSARLHVLRDGRAVWQVLDSGMGRGIPAAGVFSLAASRKGLFAVGGDYSSERTQGDAGTWSGRRLVMRREIAPRGYRSGAACVNNAFPCIAVGPSGVDAWNGRAWRPLSDIGYDAIDFAGAVGWASGDAGRIARIDVSGD